MKKKNHGKIQKRKCRQVSLKLAAIAKRNSKRIITGKTICHACASELYRINEQNETSDSDTSYSKLENSSPQLDYDRRIDEDSVINNIKKAFIRNQEKSTKLFLLTLLPRDWYTCMIMEVMGTTHYMASTAKKMVDERGEHGIYPERKKNISKLSEETIDLVRNFYRDECISQPLPGKNDFRSVRDGRKTHPKTNEISFVQFV